MIKKTSNVVPTMASVVNATNNSTTDTYSCKYVNELQPVVLYSNDNGSNTSVSLSDSVANYSYIEIIYRSNDGSGYKCSSGRINKPNNTVVSLTFFHYAGVLYCKQSEASVSGSTITLTNNCEWYFGTGNTPTINTTSNIYIIEVIGYK